MNAENLKNDLQQVLNSDLALRKEFNELKRSLSDYRNQLIMRDEDCKRLQVTIDVLNTKLVVMERDNTTYKGELQSFKELRGSIKEQLQAKQDEIDARLLEIEHLKAELSGIASGYETKIDQLREESAHTLSQLKAEYDTQLGELRSGTHYKEMGIREEYENRLLSISQSAAEKEQTLQNQHQEAIQNLTHRYETEMADLKARFETYQTETSTSYTTELAAIKNQHEQTVLQMEEQFNQKTETLEYNHRNALTALKLELEEQRNGSVSILRDELNALMEQSQLKEQELKGYYEGKLEEQNVLHKAATETLVNRYSEEIESLKSTAVMEKQTLEADYEQKILNLKTESDAHIQALRSELEQQLSDAQNGSSKQLDEIVAGYEEKLSNTLIHSNSQNTRLTEELSKVQLENDHFKEKIREMVIHIDNQNEQFAALSQELASMQIEMEGKLHEMSAIQNEFDAFRLAANETEGETLQNLREEIETLNKELTAITANLEHATHQLAEAENKYDSRSQEVNDLLIKVTELETNLETVHSELRTKEALLNDINNQYSAELSAKEEQWNVFKEEQEVSNSQLLKEKEIEFQKLLAENANLINEIDVAQDKIDVQENEILLLKSELEELRAKGEGRVNDLRETLNLKNFEITTLQANNAAFQAESEALKQEVSNLNAQLTMALQGNDQLTALQHNYDVLLKEKQTLLSQINDLHGSISNLNETIFGLNDKINNYEQEISALNNRLSEVNNFENQTVNSKSEAEQDAFIDRLFKQIDVLNDERLTLLNEKEAMATQLLKMNDVVSGLSQEVDSQNINVLDLNNHRKNVILASSLNEGSDERRQMKTQINELLREIDKCIALLSA